MDHHYTIRPSKQQEQTTETKTNKHARTDDARVLALPARLLFVQVVELGLAPDRLPVVHVRLAHLLVDIGLCMGVDVCVISRHDCRYVCFLGGGWGTCLFWELYVYVGV